MEFRYRAVDRKPTTYSSIPYPSNRSLQVQGYPMTNTFGMEAVGGDAQWREMEKEQIRREIIADEIEIAWRKRQFEDEVRRELAVKRMRRYLAAPTAYSFQERGNPVAVDDVDVDNNFIIRVSQPPLHHDMLSQPCNSPHIQNQKDKKAFMLPRPNSNPDLHCPKRKASTPAICDTEPSEATGLRKKAKKEWNCSLCQVNTTSQKHLNKHLRGKKHKAKEAGDRTQMIGLEAKPDSKSPQPRLILREENQNMVDNGVQKFKNEEAFVQKSHNVVDKENQNERVTKQAGKTKASLATRKASLWCKVCKVRAFSHDVMDAHKKGKRHQRKMKKFCQN